MKYSTNISLILSLLLFFSACTDSAREERQKKDCLSKNKTYAYSKELNYRTGKYEIRIVCK